MHRFYQNWQQIDCDVTAATREEPQQLPERSVSLELKSPRALGEGAASMGVYDSRRGLGPYHALDQLVRNYAMSDNFHQAFLRTGRAQTISSCFSARRFFYPNPDGTPGTPPSLFIENPNPRAQHEQRLYRRRLSQRLIHELQRRLAAGRSPPIRDYLAALPSHPAPGCYPGEFYLVNNFGPGFFGNGSRAPLSTSDFRIPPTSQPHIRHALLNKHGVSWSYYASGWAGGSEGVGFLRSLQRLSLLDTDDDERDGAGGAPERPDRSL